MCTSLIYRDAAGKVYLGRTLELTMELPYQIVFFPKALAYKSRIEGHPDLEFTGNYAFIGITMPGRRPTPDNPLTYQDLKPLEGMNEQGLTFSLLSYPSAGGKQQSVETTAAVLSASDLGSWALSQFATVAQVRKALEDQPVLLEPLALLGGVESPFHYVVHDASGASLVVEFNLGKMSLYDNPVGVMTNGPEFPWHLTNLDNYTFLSNVDKTSAQFGDYHAVQPDSGIATAGLPASNTSVGRFVRAAYYAQFTEKAASPDEAVVTLAHVMNNFDRARGVTIDYPEEGGGHLEVAGLSSGSAEAYATEFTSWTNLSDLDRKLFHVRTYGSLNYSSFDLGVLSRGSDVGIMPISALKGGQTDATTHLQGTAQK
ncbi:linear amide C-N hydrolase [Labrenzia sp. 011]|uniref:linear amide C-N hydrolase n=1 Tax=Labrenzia sp. 011 TaxID=2171494 RepID=UPI000D5190CD|nr:linear amide C-N hydrolase [Labrenzia sp. 011]PVB60469.1 linear amide C-N hydrolase [Labrenzia sp. 011]